MTGELATTTVVAASASTYPRGPRRLPAIAHYLVVQSSDAPNRTSKTSRLRQARRLVFGSDEGIAGTVYGTIVAMATLVAGVGFAADPWNLAAVVGATVVVAWIAHVYAHGLAQSINAGLRLDGAELRAIARRERSIPLAAIGPLAALVLGATDLLNETTAVWLGLSIGLATLALQGTRYARVVQLGRAGTIVAVAVNLALGMIIVAFKVLLVH